MDAERHVGFIKDLMKIETTEVVSELNNIIVNTNKADVDKENSTLRCFLTNCSEEIKSDVKVNAKPEYDNLIRGRDISNILTLIFDYKLDFENRLGVKRDVLEQWQKTRAYKNEEFSIKFRENGNDYLRKGELNHALHFYNEALMFGELRFSKHRLYQNITNIGTLVESNMLMILFILLALPESVNFAMILANRAVPLFKIKQFKLAIDDLHESIQTGKYPSENLHKLYQRLATAHEHLQEYQQAIEMYRKQFDSMRSSSLLKSQKLQMKSDIEKSMARCKRGSGAQNFTNYQSDCPSPSSADFPVYRKLHSQLPNASGMFIRWPKGRRI